MTFNTWGIQTRPFAACRATFVQGPPNIHHPTLLLLPRLVADGGPDGDLRAALLVDAALAADEDAEAALLEDGDVVVVGVAHGPARGVLLRLLRRGRVDEAAVPVGPLLEGVEALALQEGPGRVVQANFNQK